MKGIFDKKIFRSLFITEMVHEWQYKDKYQYIDIDDNQKIIAMQLLPRMIMMMIMTEE